MPRKATGSYYKSGDLWYASVTLGAGSKGRRSIPLPVAKTEEQAAARAMLVNELAQKLRAAGLVADAQRFLIEAGSRDGKALERVRRAVDALSKGELTPKRAALQDATFAEVGTMWASGELARDYKDHVKVRSTSNADRQKLETQINPVVGHVRVKDFQLEHGEAAMAALPAALMGSTRRNYAKMMVRVLNLCVYPLKIIKSNPLPRGFVPKEDPEKAKSCVYPDEDAQLLGSSAVDVEPRVLYGFLHREGMRYSEAAGCTWTDFDLARGGVNLDKNKTNDPRAWALQRGVARTIAAFRLYREATEGPLADNSAVFANCQSRTAAERYREHLRAAGISRPALFQQDATRRRIRAHDMRATFITISLANGRTETWVQDRTGHKHTTMINTYRRTARTVAELGLGDLRPLDELIPELAPFLVRQPGESAGGRGKDARGNIAGARSADAIGAPASQHAQAQATTAPAVVPSDARAKPQGPAEAPANTSARQRAAGEIVARIVADGAWDGLVGAPSKGGFVNGLTEFAPYAHRPTIRVREGSSKTISPRRGEADPQDLAADRPPP